MVVKRGKLVKMDGMELAAGPPSRYSDQLQVSSYSTVTWNYNEEGRKIATSKYYQRIRQDLKN